MFPRRGVIKGHQKFGLFLDENHVLPARQMGGRRPTAADAFKTRGRGRSPCLCFTPAILFNITWIASIAAIVPIAGLCGVEKLRLLSGLIKTSLSTEN
jgi:hypothetical protein